MMVRDSWLGTTANLGSIGALYSLTMDPYEKYDMVFNGAAPSRVLTSSPGRYTGEDNGWALSLIYLAIIDFDKSIIKYPNIALCRRRLDRSVPDLQHPDNPVPLLKDQIDRLHIGGNGG
jgi:arylsulfatase